MEKIGIFCSASGNIDKMYFDMAGRIGKWMGETGKTLVYGGASLGLMECVAQAVKTNGGHIIGVVPAKLEENGKVSALPGRIIPLRLHTHRTHHFPITAFCRYFVDTHYKIDRKYRTGTRNHQKDQSSV